MDLGISGLASGFDWRSLVDQLSEVERAPQQRLRTEQSALAQRNNAFTSIKTQLGVLQNRVTALQDPGLYTGSAGSVGDATVASITTDATAAGSYTFSFTQLATPAEQRGATDMAGALSATNNVSSLALTSSKFATAITAGTFTVIGGRVTVATTDTLQDVFTKISTATGGQVTASYDHTTDKITLTSGSTIVLGSAGDTSNFLSVARLYNNGSATSLSSASALGSANLTAAMAGSNLRTAIDDGGAGEIYINGVTINYNVATDSIANVLARISSSAAGVTANYDPINDRFTLRNKVTGDTGIAFEDITGNFFEATGLLGGATERGKNLLYSINGGPTAVSASNAITPASSQIAGLTVTALKEGASTTVQVAAENTKLKTAISAFLEEYNKVQTLFDAQTASSTDAKGKVTAGVLAADSDAGTLASRLRSLAFGEVSGLSTTIKQLAALGIDSNGTDNKLTLADSSKLDDAVANHLGAVKNLFTDATNGLATRLDHYLTATIGDDGSLLSHQDLLTKQSTDIDTQVADSEKLVLNNRQRLIDSFVAMETARARMNQQLQFLNQRFGSGSSS